METSAMNMPGFTAENSQHSGRKQYHTSATENLQEQQGNVVPQVKIYFGDDCSECHAHTIWQVIAGVGHQFCTPVYFEPGRGFFTEPFTTYEQLCPLFGGFGLAI
jgi:hypothetical protein